MEEHWDIDEEFIANVTDSVTLFQQVDATSEQMQLAAAAPELLEALQGLLVRAADDEEYGPYHAITKARQAIAKALGQQPL